MFQLPEAVPILNEKKKIHMIQLLPSISEIKKTILCVLIVDDLITLSCSSYHSHHHHHIHHH